MKYILLLFFLFSLSFNGIGAESQITIIAPSAKSFSEKESLQKRTKIVVSVVSEPDKKGVIRGTLLLDTPDSLRYKEIDVKILETGQVIQNIGKNSDKSFELTGLDSVNYTLAFFHEFYDTLKIQTIKLVKDETVNIIDVVDLSPKLKPSWLNIVIQFDNNLDGDGKYEEVNIKSDIDGTFDRHPIDSTGILKQEVSRGWHNLTASLEHYTDGTEKVKAIPGSTIAITLKPKFKNGFIKGVVQFDTVYHDNDDLRDVILKLNNEDVNTNINGNGEFIIEYLEPSKEYTLTALHPHYKQRINNNFQDIVFSPGNKDTIPNGDTLLLEYEFGDLAVNVINEDSTRLNGVLVIVTNGSLNSVDTAKTTNNGIARLSEKFQEEIVLSIQDTTGDYIIVDSTITIEGGEQIIDIVLKKKPTVIIKTPPLSFKPSIEKELSDEKKSFDIIVTNLTEPLIVSVPEKSNYKISYKEQNTFVETLEFAVTKNKTYQVDVKQLPIEKLPHISEMIKATTNYYRQKESKIAEIEVTGEGLEMIKVEINAMNGAGLQVCKGTPIHLNATVSGGGVESDYGEYTYKWEDNSSIQRKDTSEFESGLINSNNYEIVLIVTDSFGFEGSDIVTVNHYDTASTEIFTKGGDEGILIYTQEVGYDYQWFNNNDSIVGETLQYFYPGGDESAAIWEPGNYHVVLTDITNKCEYQSTIIPKGEVKSAILANALESNFNLFEDILIYPNPTSDKVTLYSNQFNEIGINKISLLNSLGKTLKEQTGFIDINSSAMEFNLTGYPPGLYFLKIAGEKESITKKIIIK